MKDVDLRSEKSGVTKDLTKEKLSKVMKEAPHSDESENLEKWYSDYIDYFREEYEKLTDEEKKCVSNTKNFLKPCQIEVFWMKNPPLQLIIQSNLPNRKDMEIFIHGPFTTREFRQKAESILQEPRWNQKIEEPYVVDLGSSQPYTYAERLASNIFQFIKMVIS